MTTPEEFVERLNSCPKAHSVQVYFCDGEDCHRPHVLLFDEGGMPIAQFVMPDRLPEGQGGFVNDLLGAMYRSAVERDLRDDP